MSTKTAIAEMICGHTVEVNYSGTAGIFRDREFCPGCNEIKGVNEYHREQWHSRCKTGCKYSRTHGYSKVYAERAAATHFVRTGHETSVLWYRDLPPRLPEPLATLTEFQPTLVAENGSIPF